MKPLISYYGGKQKMAPNIIPLIPKHTVYVEPFAGGCSILFMKPEPKILNTSKYIEVINDIDGNLINMYRIFQTRFDEIQHLLEFTLYSEEEYRKAVDIIKGKIKTDDLWRAWAYYVNVSQSFASILNGGWGRGVTKCSANRWVNKIKNLNVCKDRMKGVTISHCHALKCIKQWDSPQTFFYCDPPYNKTEQGHYKGFTFSDFLSLVLTLKRIQGSFILSTYGFKLFKIPKEWEVFTFKTKCAASGKGRVGADRTKISTTEEMGDTERVEYVYKQNSKAELRSDIQKIYNSDALDCFTG